MNVVWQRSDTDWWIAESAEAAREMMLNGDVDPDVTSTEFSRVPDDEVIAIWCDADGDPTEPDSDGASVIKRTAKEWAACRPEGMLCTTEI